MNIFIICKNHPMGCVIENAVPTHLKYRESDVIEPADIEEHEGGFSSIPCVEVAGRACGYGFYQAEEKDACQNGLSHQETSTTLSGLNFNEIVQVYESCRHFYEEHDIDHAKTQADLLESLCLKYNEQTNHEETISSFQESKIQKFKVLIQTVNEEYSDVLQYGAEIDKEGWIEKTNKSGIKVSSRKEGSTFGVLVETVTNYPVQVLLTVLTEIDLYTRYTPFMKVARMEKKVSRNSRIGYTESHIPFLSIRQAFFQGIAYDRLQTDGTLFMYTRSIHNRKDRQQKLDYTCKVNPDNIQLDYKYLVIKYEPLDESRGKVTMAMNIDTKMNFLPDWLVDKVSSDFGYEFLINIMKLSKNFKGSQWETNMRKDPSFFDFFKGVTDSYLVNLKSKGQPNKF